MVVAVATNGVIGRQGDLPWRLSSDLKHFKALTLEKPVIMGRLTYESIGRPLPDRHNIVVSRQQGYGAPGCTVVDSLAGAIAAAGAVPETMIIGGAALYRQALPITDVIHLTQVHAEIDGDTFFAGLNFEHWQEVEREDHQRDAKNQYDYSFVTLVPKPSIQWRSHQGD